MAKKKNIEQNCFSNDNKILLNLINENKNNKKIPFIFYIQVLF